MGNSEAIDSDDTATRAAQTLALISASFEQMIIPMSTGGDLTRDLIGPLTNAVLDACETLTDRIEARVRDSAIGD